MKSILSALLIATLLSSCCQSVYFVTDPVVTANVKQKSDANLTAGLNTGSTTGGFHFNGSYALTEKYFVSASATHYSGSCRSSNSNNGTSVKKNVDYSGNSMMGAFGYYKPLGNNFYFESCAGLKFGTNFNFWKIDSTQNANTISTKENIQFYHLKYFIQPGIAYNRKHFQAGLGLRMGVLDYLPRKTGSLNSAPSISHEAPVFLFEPGLQVCGGGEYVKFGAEFTGTLSDLGPLLLDPLSNVFFSSTDRFALTFFLKVGFGKKMGDKTTPQQ
ncbi:MAG TPA: hypothetical protein VI112_10615 [Bacteroidia bacterium]|jgi:hypothetical protein